jgi:hypothetical protein
MRRAQWLWGVGAVLLAVSAYPLFLTTREMAMRSRAGAEYEVTPESDATRLRLQGQEVAVADGAVPSCRDCADVVAPVTTLVDGRSYSSEMPMVIRPRFTDGRRYGSWISLARVTEKKNGAVFLAVIQRVRPRPGVPVARDGAGLFFRLLLVGQDGAVRSETFPYAHRDWPQYRTVLAARVSPTGTGVYPAVLHPVLDPFFPLLFPGGSTVLGLALVLVASRMARRAQSSAGTGAQGPRAGSRPPAPGRR